MIEVYTKLVYIDKINKKKTFFEMIYATVVRIEEEKPKTEEIKKLIDICDLNWDIKCLEFYKNKKSIKTVSFAQARKPIYNSSIKSWENYSSYLDVLKENLNNV